VEGEEVADRIKELESERLKLETHTFHLQRKVAQLLRELQRLRQPPLMVGSVLEVLGDGLAVVRLSNGNTFIVPVLSGLEVAEGDRVGLAQQSLAVVYKLPQREEHPFVVTERPKVTFRDVAGLEEQVEMLREVVELPLKRPEIFKELGVEPPKGVLLYGPPGTGKTLLARAVAGETEATFIHVVGSELVRKYIGEGAKLVKEIFRTARKRTPSIIFIDEIDAIGGRREEASNGEREVHRTLIQLLAEMDGFRPLEGVVVMAATNRPDLLDPALLRPGRFDRHIHVPLPDASSRRKIIQLYLSRMKNRGIEVEKLVRATNGFSGADIKNLLTEAGYRAIRKGRSYIVQEDVDEVLSLFQRREHSPHFG